MKIVVSFERWNGMTEDERKEYVKKNRTKYVRSYHDCLYFYENIEDLLEYKDNASILKENGEFKNIEYSQIVEETKEMFSNKIKGFEKLTTENKILFKEFIFNFYTRWGLNARKTIKLLKIKEVKEKGSFSYLQFEYEIYNQKECLHVKSPGTWY